jgi:pheromone shutdown protein TraB
LPKSRSITVYQDENIGKRGWAYENSKEYAAAVVGFAHLEDLESSRRNLANLTPYLNNYKFKLNRNITSRSVVKMIINVWLRCFLCLGFKVCSRVVIFSPL